jgi:hypothetical protein
MLTFNVVSVYVAGPPSCLSSSPAVLSLLMIILTCYSWLNLFEFTARLSGGPTFRSRLCFGNDFQESVLARGSYEATGGLLPLTQKCTILRYCCSFCSLVGKLKLSVCSLIHFDVFNNGLIIFHRGCGILYKRSCDRINRRCSAPIMILAGASGLNSCLENHIDT